MNNKLNFFLILCFIVTNTFAAVEPEMAKETITEILAEPAFKTNREESRWQYIGESSSEPKLPEISSFNFVNFIATLFELLLWILLGAGIIFLIIYVSSWLKPLRPLYSRESDYIASPNPRLLNQEIKDSLPIDIPEKAWRFWQSGDTIAAISLLYRGALSVLVTRDGLMINDSATESECLFKVDSKQAVDVSSYFSGLTRTWQKMAYAGRLPSDIEAQRLCEEWQRYFG